MRSLLQVCFLLLFALGACKKPILEVTDKTVPPMVLSASIHDSLPLPAIKALNLSNITGVKIQYYTGLYATYFEYEADKQQLLKVLSALPFSLGTTVADTTCHSISHQELTALREKLSPIEFENASFFWRANPVNAEIFECIKPPYRHIIQVSSNSTRILHRIEFLG
jgi:hypothetical protein